MGIRNACVCHGPISTATTPIACSCGQSRVGLVLVHGLGQSKALPASHPNQSCHCVALSSLDGEVVIHYGHLILTTRLLSLGNILTLLRAFYTMRYIDDAKGWLILLRSTPLLYHIRKVMADNLCPRRFK